MAQSYALLLAGTSTVVKSELLPFSTMWPLSELRRAKAVENVSWLGVRDEQRERWPLPHSKG